MFTDLNQFMRQSPAGLDIQPMNVPPMDAGPPPRKPDWGGAMNSVAGLGKAYMGHKMEGNINKLTDKFVGRGAPATTPNYDPNAMSIKRQPFQSLGPPF